MAAESLLRLRRGAVVSAVLLTACAAGPVETTTAYLPENAAEMFSSGYGSILDYYIDDVKVGELALHGMQGLRGIDSRFDVARQPGALVVSVDRARIAEFPLPDDNDTTRWGMLTAAVISAGRLTPGPIAEAEPERLYDAVFKATLADLDRFSRYAGRDEARLNRASRQGFGGIGIAIESVEQGTRVTRVFPDTPAADALAPGDFVTHTDGRPLAGLDGRDVVELLRGSVGSKVRLTVVRDRATFSVDLVRAKIVPPTVEYSLEGNVAVIKVSGFNTGTAEAVEREVAHARAELGQRLAGMVLDLRGNPGGLLDQAVNVADLFVRRGEIISTRGRHPGSRQHFAARSDDIIDGLPLVVLIDGASASAAEVAAAALQDAGRALVVGSRSYGKGTVQTVVRMPNGGELTLTWAKMFAPSGYGLSDLGVMPAICTAEHQGGARALVEAVRRGDLDPATPLGERRTADARDTASIGRLDRACRQARGQPKSLDLEVALGLIGDPGLFRRAVDRSLIAMQPSTAAR